ncbi:MAG: nitroreductase family protein [Zoogloeaceae bacterium]|jgi:nitroreductase|nr:nitroreductase family protein [Zoogloeaceae bacterium]
MIQERLVERGVDPLFVNRWSPRAFDESSIPKAELQRFFEAARWAPSAYNAQPWRFVYARRDTPHWEIFLALLGQYNRDWARRASALVIVLSARDFVLPGQGKVIDTGYQSFDTGAAVACFSLQASMAGWHSHIIAGLDKERTKEALGIPEGYTVEVAIAVGRQGDAQILPPTLQQREAPSGRNPLASLMAEGRFAFRD